MASFAGQSARIRRHLERRWRQLATLLCFASFGLLALAHGLLAAPLALLLVHPGARRRHLLRRIVRWVMRLFVAQMRLLRVLDLDVRGMPPDTLRGTLVIANHPTLIDALLLFALLPPATCVIKPSLRRNPFLGLAIGALGYITHDGRATVLVENCEAAIRAGETLIIFPEGTRTEAGGPIVMQRFPAFVALRTGCPVLPITIRVTEPLLTKGLGWSAVPERRPVFSVVLHPIETTDGGPVDTAGMNARARTLTRRWQANFSKESASGSKPA